MSGWKNRIDSWFIDREFFMRANGQVKFLKVSAKLQRRVAGIVALVIGIWAVITLGMLLNQVSVSIERSMLNNQQAKVESAQERVAKYKGDIEETTADLERRQKMLESLGEKYFDGEPATTEPAASEKSDADRTAEKIGALVPEAAGLARIEARQIRFAVRLTKLADARAAKAAAAIRKYGLDPNHLANEAQEGMGGPFIPFFGSKSKDVRDPRFTRLAASLERMDSMERALAGIPSSMPADAILISSEFGYRHDPINGAGAMHAGLDFKGPIGTLVMAAADGVVSFAGYHNGYGNCIEITHANGLVTRYAHLSRYNVEVGQTVKRGIQIGNIGNTGRSTGPHLHFEVRLDGEAINPMKFLEAHSNVLKIKDGA